MAENDFQKEIKKVTKRTIHEGKQELAQEEASSKQKQEEKESESESESTSYTAIIIAKLEYDGAGMPSKEQLAEDLGRTIMKWADQKGFYGISPREPIPKLISVDVDIK
ncbi:hypothetical protein ACFLTO_03920 [Chloroflexota bacterium]